MFKDDLPPPDNANKYTTESEVKSAFNIYDQQLHEGKNFPELPKGEFPINVFAECIQQVIKETNKNLDFPIDFIGASLLAAASAAIGNTYRLKIRANHTEGAAIFMAVVGDPGTNKSHPMKFAFYPINKHDKKLFAEYQRQSEQSAQSEGTIPKPKLKKTCVHDVTPEALTEALFNNLRGICSANDELASWFKNFNRYNNSSEESFWLSVWSFATITIDRKTSGHRRIDRPFISVIGSIQPALLHELAKNNRAQSGFIDRILFAYPDGLKKQKWTESDLPEHITEKWDTIVNFMLEWEPDYDEDKTPLPKELPLQPDAKKLLFEFQESLTKQWATPGNEDFKGIYSKFDIHTPRLALILQLMNDACNEREPKAIDANAVLGAISLAEYFMYMAEKVNGIVFKADPLALMPTNKRNWYVSLSDVFKTDEAIKAASDFDIMERTVKKYLNDKFLFEKIEHGAYQKKH